MNSKAFSVYRYRLATTCPSSIMSIFSVMCSYFCCLLMRTYSCLGACRQHSERYGTRILTETITDVDLLVHDVHPLALHRRSMEDVLLGMEMEESHRPRRPFKLWTPERCVTADTVIISTGGCSTALWRRVSSTPTDRCSGEAVSC